MKKRILSLLLALVLLVGLLPTVALAEETGDPTTQVHVIVENTTYPKSAGAPWDGTLVETWVTLEDDSTMLGCVEKALEEYTVNFNPDHTYISNIYGLGEFDGGTGSGWMGTLNDWFTNEGFGAFTAESGKLTAGDEIRIMYTTNLGEDLGGSWSNNNKTVKAISFSAGTLDKTFDKDTHAYTLTVPTGTTGVKVTPTATNKNFQVRASVGTTEYKRTQTIPVSEGTVITVKCGDNSWPTMNNQAGGTSDEVAAETYTFTVKMGAAAPTPLTGLTISNGTTTKTLDFVSGQTIYEVDVEDWNKVYIGVVGAMSGDVIWVNSSQIQYNETAMVEVTAATSPKMARVMINRGTDQPVQAWVKLTSTYSETKNYLQSLSFKMDYDAADGYPMGTTPAYVYTMTPAFDPAITAYTVYVPENIGGFFADVTLAETAPAGTDVVFKYSFDEEDTYEFSYLNDGKTDYNGVVELEDLIYKDHDGATVTVQVGNPAKEYTITIVRQPVVNYLSLKDSDGKECLTSAFANETTFSGYTAYIPYAGATVRADARKEDWTTVKIGEDTVPTTGYTLDATTLWTGEAGQRQFELKINLSSTEVTGATSTYTITCKERPTLAVKTAPTKTQYTEGESFDSTGLVLTAAYHDKTVEIPLADVTFANTEITKNSKPVTATYQGATVELEAFTVTNAFTGEGTEEKPYLLNSAADLAVLSHLVASGETHAGKYFKITDNITLPSDWTPIGSLKEGQKWSSDLRYTGYNLFSGSIDGLKNAETGECYTITVPKGSKTMLGALKNSTISNLNIYGEQIDGYGVVEYYHNGASGIVIDNVTLKSGSHTKYSGFIGGYASGSNPVVIRNCTVEADVVIGDDGTVASWAEDVKKTISYPYGPAGTIQRNDMIGSFAGAFNGTIENCVSHATVYGRNYVGGIMGFKGQSMGDCIVRECVFDGQVIATGNYVGGIVGSGYEATSGPNTPCVTIQNCAVTGSVKGGNYVGGIFGGNAVNKQCWNNGIGYIRGNYFDGTLAATAENAVVGGIIGHINTIDRYNIIQNNYYRKGTATGGIGSITTVDTNTDTQYGRTDDPMGVDADKLAAAFEQDELANGNLVEKLNAATVGNAWKQSGSTPALRSEKHVVRMDNSYLNAMSPKTFKQSTFQTELAKSTYDITVTWSDGSTEKVSAAQCTLGGLDLTTSGYQLGSLTYQGYKLYFGAKINADDSAVANPVIEQIKALGTITLESKDDLEAAEAAYAALSASQKALVTNADTLTAARTAYNQLVADKAAADAVTAKIGAIGEVTLESEAAIADARSAFNALSADQKKLVDESVLTAAEQKLAKLKKDKADQEAAEAVEDLIDDIGRVTLNSRQKINAARSAYNALTSDQKKLVSNYDDLEAAEAKYAQLKKQVALAGAASILGGASEPKAEFPFTDVAGSAWYYESVKNAWENGLIDGMNATQFQPEGTLTVAQAVKLAAALHQMYVDGEVTLKNGTGNWYDTYVAYAVENRIIEEKYAGYTMAQMNAAITRAEFVHIFHGAMGSYYACNQVADNAIPDVKSGDAYADEIYEFYRAGILIGSDGKGTFQPASSIKRSEVATILIRMYDTNARQAITLG